MMNLVSRNPSTGEVYKEFSVHSQDEVEAKINQAQTTFELWRDTNFATRRELLSTTATILREKKEIFAKNIVMEVGKRITEARAEVEKCAWVCDFYAQNGEKFLTEQSIESDAKKSYVRFEPLGVILAIMPWNFPFWQVFRCASPAIMAGNPILLKHASNVSESALKIEQIFNQAGAPKGLFQTLLINSQSVGKIVTDFRIRSVSLTGSEEAGKSVASLAGSSVKKVVLELGGSDPFIVLEDADIKNSALKASESRMIVSGQSCIAAKRFIVNKKIIDQFVEELKKNLETKQAGDPMDESTGFGPVISQTALDAISDQVEKSVAMGAKIVLGGKKIKRPGYYYAPTILTNVHVDMPVMNEETFGPVATVIESKDDKHALQIANNSRFGLGASVWTKDEKRAEFFTKNIQAGGVFINSIVKSDPRMPFGGSKFSGYGRELSEVGIKEFTNLKSVWIE